MKTTISLVFLFMSVKAISQAPPASFLEGLEMYRSDPAKARTLFYDAVKADSLFYGSYNFIGIAFANEKKYDSALYYLKTAIRLNQKNINHTKEFTLARLCRIYTRTSDFENAYSTALQCVSDYPDNSNFLSELRDACLWSYNIKYAGLKIDYLNTDPLPEYTVNGVSQEYLIMRNISINGEFLSFKSQGYNTQKNMDVLECVHGKENKVVNLNFKLAWEVSKKFGDNMPDYKIVYENKSLPIYYRVGAVLSGPTKTDMLEEIKKMSK